MQVCTSVETNIYETCMKVLCFMFTKQMCHVNVGEINKTSFKSKYSSIIDKLFSIKIKLYDIISGIATSIITYRLLYCVKVTICEVYIYKVPFLLGMLWYSSLELRINLSLVRIIILHSNTSCPSLLEQLELLLLIIMYVAEVIICLLYLCPHRSLSDCSYSKSVLFF